LSSVKIESIDTPSTFAIRATMFAPGSAPSSSMRTMVRIDV
jgi:hypothetical protein